jgi:glycosyltransferase involved in cell wall biosynthesis
MEGFSVVLPAFNEEAGLHSTLERLCAYLRGFATAGRWELIVVDDGSTDGTAEVAREFARRDPVRVRFLQHPLNLGLSAALETGAAAASTSVVVVIDADLSYAPETIGPLVAALEETGAACAFASPYMRGGSVENVPFLRLAASVAANRLLSLCAFGRLKTLTGMVRAYDARLLCDLLARRGDAEFNSWSAAMMLAARLPLVEIPARLAWPAHRRASAGRLRLGSLAARTAGVLRSLRVFAGLERSPWLPSPRSGTFVPPNLADGLISGHR